MIDSALHNIKENKKWVQSNYSDQENIIFAVKASFSLMDNAAGETIR